MAYGLQFYGDAGQLIFDTDNFDGGQTLVVTGSGNISNNANYTYPSNKIVFGRVSSGNMLGNTSTSGVFTNRSGSTIAYIEAEFTNNSTTNLVTGADYGLEIFDSSTPTQNVTFSTRKTDKTLNFIQVWDKAALTSETDVVYEDTNGISDIYVSMDYMFYSNTTNYGNGFNFTSTKITYKGRLQSSGGFGFNWDFTIPNLSTIGVIKLRG